MGGAGGDRCHRRVDVGGAPPSTSLERICNLPTVSAIYGPRGWADLPDGLLHSILYLLVSFPDLLAFGATFGATCPSWRAAFSSYPSKSSFSTLLPPLLLQPDVPLCSPRPVPRGLLVPIRPCYVTNLASQNMYCQIPLFCHFGRLHKFIFIGASFGNLILSNQESCLVVDVFTGVSVSPPPLPLTVHALSSHATLTGPLVSPNSHLMVTTQSLSFFWRVGTNSWVIGSGDYGPFKQTVVFKGQVFCTDNACGLFIVHLVPHIRIQKIVDWGESMIISRLQFPLNWLVPCGDMLLMVLSPRHFVSTGDTFEVFHLDLSTEPAKWVKVEKLENWAIFISKDMGSQVLCCMDPERWGGRSNCIYCYVSEEWIACELGKPLHGGASVLRFDRGCMMQPMWVVPSMFYPCP